MSPAAPTHQTASTQAWRTSKAAAVQRRPARQATQARLKELPGQGGVHRLLLLGRPPNAVLEHLLALQI